MNCTIIYYIAYKTGYIQRLLDRKFKDRKDIIISAAAAAVSPEDMAAKLEQSLENSDLVFVIGGLSASTERSAMTVLSEYFGNKDMEVTFNKRIINPRGGKDGYLICSGEKYIAVLPDEPSQVNDMVGNELIKNIDICESVPENDTEQITTHSIVFAPEPDYTLDKIGKNKKQNNLIKVCAAVGILTVICAVVWILVQSGYIGRQFFG